MLTTSVHRYHDVCAPYVEPAVDGGRSYVEPEEGGEFWDGDAGEPASLDGYVDVGSSSAVAEPYYVEPSLQAEARYEEARSAPAYELSTAQPRYDNTV